MPTSCINPRILASLLAKLLGSRLDMVSEMVRLNCESLAERMMVPAFVYFLSNAVSLRESEQSAFIGRRGGRRDGSDSPRSARTHRRHRNAIKDALIDDVALAKAVKRGGPIFLAHSELAESVRRYPTFVDIWHMISRTAFTQLRYSPLLLLGTVARPGCHMARTSLGSGLCQRLAVWLRGCRLPAGRHELHSHSDPLPAQQTLDTRITHDRRVLHGRDNCLGVQLLAGQRRELEESRLPPLTSRLSFRKPSPRPAAPSELAP